MFTLLMGGSISSKSLPDTATPPLPQSPLSRTRTGPVINEAVCHHNPMVRRVFWERSRATYVSQHLHSERPIFFLAGNGSWELKVVVLLAFPPPGPSILVESATNVVLSRLRKAVLFDAGVFFYLQTKKRQLDSA